MRLMRRVLALLLGLTMLTALTTAARGPEPPRAVLKNWPIRIKAPTWTEAHDTIFADLWFQERPYGEDGWDWGDRDGYTCAYSELVDGGATTALTDDRVIAEIVVEQYDQGGIESRNGGIDDDLYASVNSDHVVGGDDRTCSKIGTTNPGMGGTIVPATALEESRSYGGVGQPSFAHGHLLQIWQNGVEVARLQTPHTEPEFAPNAEPNSFWFVGDEDGELLMWYATCPNRFTCTDANGDGTITSADGGYAIVARVKVYANVAGVTFDDCVLNNPAGTPCPQTYPNEPAPTVSPSPTPTVSPSPSPSPSPTVSPFCIAHPWHRKCQ